MIKKGQYIEGSKVLILGITFKENCLDLRNSHEEFERLMASKAEKIEA
jgi:UDP-N-acetyl-D-mannosaminuronate dehydrogenase